MSVGGDCMSKLRSRTKAGEARCASAGGIRGNARRSGSRCSGANTSRGCRTRDRRGEDRRRGYATGRSIPVPVRLRLAQALAQSNQLVSLCLHGLDHVASQVLGGLLVDIVCDGLESVRLGVTRVDGLLDVVLGVLDLVWGYVVVVVGVEVEVGDDVS